MPKVCPVCDTVYADTNAFCPVDGTTLHVVDLDGGLIGSVVADRYLVTDLLGEGGMGKVYLARHVRLPQQAAIKVLRPEMVKDPAAVARFNREASNASRIDDENVARVYDFGEAAGGTVYLAMEYVAGVSLRALIERDGALEPLRAARIVDQIGKGLDAAHRLKIIHRDLKPDNILVIEGPDGKDRVKVVDFGIAKAFGAGGGNLTKTGFVVGTPEFMSPEQLTGRPLDARSDVYALGLVAYQCLTGKLPFPGDTPEETMTGRLTRAPLRLEEATGKSWPGAVQAALDAALARDVEQRPESAGAFATRLKAAIEAWVAEGRPAPAAVPKPARTVVVAAPPPPASRRAPLFAGLALVLAVGGYFAFKAMQEGGGVPTNATEAAGGEAVTQASPNAQTPAGAALDSVESLAAAMRDSLQAARDSLVAEEALVAQRDSQLAANAAPPTSPRNTVPAPRSNVADSAVSKVAPPPASPPPAAPSSESLAADRALGDSLNSLSNALGARGVDAAGARRIARGLRELAPQLRDPLQRARAYARLLRADARSADADAVSRDLPRACEAFRGAIRGARDESQRLEVQKFIDDNGCP